MIRRRILGTARLRMWVDAIIDPVKTRGYLMTALGSMCAESGGGKIQSGSVADVISRRTLILPKYRYCFSRYPAQFSAGESKECRSHYQFVEKRMLIIQAELRGVRSVHDVGFRDV